MPTLDEIIAANDRRRRAEQALAYARATGQDNDHALRTLRANGRDYLLGPDGAITAPVAHDRPLDPGEYAALGRARAQGDTAALAALYAPERRARPIRYWDDGYLDPAAEAERREEALWRAAERRTVRSDRRAEAVRALLAHERAYGNAPSERQREAAQRWADRRALAGDPLTRAALDRRDRLDAAARDRAERRDARRLAAEGAQAQSQGALAAALAKARGTVDVAREETRRALDLAERNNAHALALETLRGENALGLAGANNASSERVAQIRAQANRDVALLQGTLAAARAQGALSPEQDAAFKRAETLVRLSQSLARGGLDETALFTLDNEIDNDKTLSPEEKAARKAQLRQNNPEAVSWLLGAAARQMEAAGLPGMPAPGQTAQANPAPQPEIDESWL